MQEDGGALDMTEEAVADAGPFMSAFDQPGNVGKHEIGAVDAHHAEIGVKRGEGIVGDLRLGRADRGQEGRLSGIGKSDDAGIGDELEPKPDMHLLALLAGIGVARRLVGRRLEAGIAESAIAAAQQNDAVAGRNEIRDQGLPVFVEDLRARGHGQHHVGALGAGAVLAHAMPALLRLEMLLVAVVEKRIEVGHAFDDDVAAFAAVAAVRAAELDELLAPEADGSRCRRRPNAHRPWPESRNCMGKGLAPAAFQYTSGEDLAALTRPPAAQLRSKPASAVARSSR